MKTIRVFEAFAGIGAQHEGWSRLHKDYPNDVQFEFVGMSEIDRYAEISYKAAHGDVSNYGDITQIDWSHVPDFDMFTWSFPCTDLSQAGKQAGMSAYSGTRSSLAWECIRALRIKRPKWALMENVKALMQKKFAVDFVQLRKEIEDLGYVNYYAVMNSKDYGVAQNRERVFMVSILRTEDEPNPTYNFPKGFPLTKCVEDYMEPTEEIGEEYYISQDRVTDKVLSDMFDQPHVREEMERLYHDEWNFYHRHGRFPKDGELENETDIL